MNRFRQIYASLGPGLLWAGAAIGVSHLVQSTRAGASYGFILILVVIVANILKYPSFEAGPRYASATGKSLLDAYRQLGRGYYVLFLILTFLTMFSITAAVTAVTAALAGSISGLHLNPVLWSALIMLLCTVLLGAGSYRLLDRGIKIIIIILSLSTLAAVLIALSRGPNTAEDFIHPPLFDMTGILFLAALIGWMPSAIDISVWHSLWSLEKQKISDEKPDLRRSLLDFNIGYVGTAFIAIAFLMLGALVMYGSGESFPSAGAAFAGRFLDLYVASLGAWSYPVIALAAFTTMFSTTITVLDAYPRVIRRAFEVGRGKDIESDSKRSLFYWASLLFTALGALLLLSVFSRSLTRMVDIATTLSFLTAPLLATLNYMTMKLPDIPASARLPRWLDRLSIVGILFLSLFALAYLYLRFFRI